MKKISYLLVLCLLVSASFASAPSPVLNQQKVFVGEPEPHPYTIVLKFRVKGSKDPVYLQWLVSYNTTIDELREVVSDWSGDDDVRMSYNGTVLLDGNTLQDYGIGAGAIISCS